jgi:low affinity Fe/Cu permease
VTKRPTEGEVKASNDWFAHFAAHASNWLGSKWAFAGAGLVIVIWAVTGPIFHFSDPWELIINTGTTIVTFLMVFLIQNTQNRDARAIHLKLDELIRAIDKARDQMIDIENLSDLELDELHAKYEKIKAECDSRQMGKRTRMEPDVNDGLGTCAVDGNQDSTSSDKHGVVNRTTAA